MAQKSKRGASSAKRVHLEKDRPLIDIEGIGETFAARFGAIGVRTVHELEALDADEVAPQVGTNPATFRQWQSMAQLFDVHGVGPQYAELLVRSGVSSIRELAESDAPRLAAAIESAEAGRERRIQGGPEGEKTVARWIEAARRHPLSKAAPDAPPEPAPVHHERIIVIPTGLYWTCLLLSLLFLGLALGLYRDYVGVILFGAARYVYWTAVVFALIVITWTTIGLLRRGRVIHRSVTGTRAVFTGVAEGVRNRSEANEGAMGRMAAKWSRRLNRLVRVVTWIILLPYRIVLWAWYTAEKLVWRIILILYDIVYYPTYAAWLVARWALRTAFRITAWALRVAWKILRLPLYLPLIKRWWRKSMRPRILHRWRLFVAHQAHLRAKRIERGRRLAQLRGENPDRWETDHRLRHGFPLPHPEKGRVRIRKRIAHIQEAQRARREGRPVPKRPRPRKEEPVEERPDAPAPEAPQAATAAEGKRLKGLLRTPKSGSTSEADTATDA